MNHANLKDYENAWNLGFQSSFPNFHAESLAKNLKIFAKLSKQMFPNFPSLK